VGSYIGLSTALFAKNSKQVIGLEASPRNYKFLEKNTSNVDNIEVKNMAATDETGEVELNLEKSQKGVNDSILTPDSGEINQTVTVNSTRIDDLVENLGIDKLNVLKVEAEGAEPEVCSGIGDLKIDKVVVLCDNERDGNSPKKHVSQILKNKDYEILEFDDESKTLYAEYRS
jgi:FkbM family methyltransferase